MEEIVYHYLLSLVAIVLAIFNLWFLFTRHKKLQREYERLHLLLTEQNEAMNNLLKLIDKTLIKEE